VSGRILAVLAAGGRCCPLCLALGLTSGEIQASKIFMQLILERSSLLFLVCNSLALVSSQELFLILTVARGSRFSPQKVGFSWLHIFCLVFLASHLCFCCIFKENNIGYRKHKTVIPVSEKPSADLTCFLDTFVNIMLYVEC